MFAWAVLLVLPFLASSQTSTDGLALADLNDKMEQLGQEMEGLGSIMEGYGAEMEKYGEELEKNEGHAPKAQEQMEVLGKKMDELGKQMDALGKQMGAYGDKMGELHQQMINWFFKELKKDNLLPSLNGKARVIFDEKGLNVEGNDASDALFNKYKAGLEKYWGRSLKKDFLFFFKGEIKEKGGNVELNGNMNTDM